MNIPANLKYTKDHEWIRLEGDTLLSASQITHSMNLATSFSLTLIQLTRHLMQRSHLEQSRL